MTIDRNGLCTKARLVFVLLTGLFLLSACISTEPLSTAPHINLSPQTVVAEQNQDLNPNNSQNQAVDFGVDVRVNESDSLENLEILPGVRVRRVSPNSPAQVANIKAGDVILSANAIDTNHPDTLATVFQSVDAGQEVIIKARRDTTVFETTLVGQTLTRVDIEERYRVDPVLTRAGYRTEIITVDGKPTTVARIVETFPKTPFADANINMGDAIIAINNGYIESAQGLINHLNSFSPGEKIHFTFIDKNNSVQNRELHLWDPGRRISRLSLWPLFDYQAGLSPSTTQFSILDFWLFSLFEYQRENSEKTYRLLTLFTFGSGAGELVEESEANQ